MAQIAGAVAEVAIIEVEHADTRFGEFRRKIRQLPGALSAETMRHNNKGLLFRSPIEIEITNAPAVSAFEGDGFFLESH